MRKPDGRHWSCGASLDSLCGCSGDEHEHCNKNRQLHSVWSTAFDKVVTYITKGPWGWSAWFNEARVVHCFEVELPALAIFGRIVRHGIGAVPRNIHDSKGRQAEHRLLFARIFMENGILLSVWMINKLPIANGFIQFLDPGEPAVMECLKTTKLFDWIQ